MKQRLFRRGLLPLALALCLMIPLASGAAALIPDVPQEEETELYYIGTHSTFACIEIDEYGLADCWGYVDCYPGYTAKDAVMRLQWRGSDGVWYDYVTWYGEDGNDVNFTGCSFVMPGRTYRVRVVADVYDSNGNWVEMVDAVSGSEKY